MFLIGNKQDIDYQRTVKYDEGKNYADLTKMEFFEISAKTGENIEQMFTSIAKVS